MSASSITLVAVDGQGKDTPKYLALLHWMLELGIADRAVLCSSDASARHARIRCAQIPALDYLGYSCFCVEELYGHVETDFCLTVQLDGFVVNPGLWDPTFLDYDYIGAPWRTNLGRALPTNYRVGNGGFSLRSQRLLYESSQLTWTQDWSDYRLPKVQGDPLGSVWFRRRPSRSTWGNEDNFLAWVKRAELDAKGIRFAPVDVARRFSVQNRTKLDSGHTVDKTFGFHHRHLFPKVTAQLKRQGLKFPYER